MYLSCPPTGRQLYTKIVKSLNYRHTWITSLVLERWKSLLQHLPIPFFVAVECTSALYSFHHYGRILFVMDLIITIILSTIYGGFVKLSSVAWLAFIRAINFEPEILGAPDWQVLKSGLQS